MNKNSSNRRSRGRGNSGGGGGGRRGGSPRNQVFESNGPEVKVRGTAQQILDKYLQLARDAQSSGDRIRAESCLQFAEHYFRILSADGAQPQERQPRADAMDEAEVEVPGQDQGQDQDQDQNQAQGGNRGEMDEAEASAGAEADADAGAQQPRKQQGGRRRGRPARGASQEAPEAQDTDTPVTA